MPDTYCTPLLDETNHAAIVVKKCTLTDFLNQTGLKTVVSRYLNRLPSLKPVEQKIHYEALCTEVQTTATPDAI